MTTIYKRLLAGLSCAVMLAVPTRTHAAETFFISSVDFWLYLDNGVDQGTAWRQTSFNDSGWGLEVSQFGFGEGDEFTPLNPSVNTVYFRNIFNVANAGAYSNLTLRVLRDDGVVVYINGTEVFRNNMPVGAVNYNTQATRNLGGADESVIAQRVVPASVLVSGVNSIAVEIHQAAGGGDDMSFAMEFIGHLTGENQPPSAFPSFITVEQNRSTNLTLNASDPDGNPLTYTLVSLPIHGSLSGAAPNLTYTPEPGYVGPDLFSFKATDGQWPTEIAEVGIEVKLPSNRPPVADAQSLTVAEDNLLTIALTATDPDGDTLSYAFTQTSHGALTPGAGHSVVYQPAPNYFGADSFTFTVDDGNGGLATASINITVTPVNDAPTANAQNVSTLEDTSLEITLSGSDVEADALTFSFTQPAHGTLTGSDTAVVYQPAANYNGPDSFTFTVDDGNGGSTTAIVNIGVTPVNDAPTASALAAPASKPANLTRQLKVVAINNRSALIFLDGTGSTDVDGDPLSFAWYKDAQTTPFSTTGSSTVEFAVGSYALTLVVSDGDASANDTISLQVLTPCDLVNALAEHVQAAALKPSERNALLKNLNTACSKFGRGNIAAGVDELEHFQERVNKKVASCNPALAQTLNDEAEQIIQAVGGY